DTHRHAFPTRRSSDLFAIRIERVRDAGFLSGHDQLAAIRQTDERWRRAEIEIGTGYICRAHRTAPVFRSIAATPSVAGCGAPLRSEEHTSELQSLAYL